MKRLNREAVTKAINAGKPAFIAARPDWSADRIERDVLAVLREQGREHEFDVTRARTGVQLERKDL